MSEEEINVEEEIRKIRSQIDDYKRLLKALIALYKYTEEQLKGKFFFGGNIKSKNSESPVTPDIIIKLPNYAIIGEAKKSLPAPESFESKEQYIKKVIEGNLIHQLKKYDENFEMYEIKEHDIILLAPESSTEAIGILKFDYLDKQNPFKRKFSLLVYAVEPVGNTEEVRVVLSWGTLSLENFYDKLRRGIKYYTGQLTKEIGKFKIYEENETATPIVYVMEILWSQIFPEIIKKSEKDRILEWYKEQKNEFEVKLSKLLEYLEKMYSLPYISISETSRIQFKKELVLKSMENFVKIGLAEIISNGDDPTYKITWKPLPKKEIIDYFIKRMLAKGAIVPKGSKKATNVKTLNSWLK
jgi:hypothetical protein